ncbi:MAG TPA: NAD-dependent epimerase/dehydratase family protein [Anaerolineae bacterium]|nr:NAD-dependent epimerase/dehydratase family protein [Anaerolineae bacterium]HQH38103.1 NAD-dependent epimerase/dehydratase family protein [Anaerolineae bacterium]
MRILVTGGAGFLGSALSNALVRQGHEVLVLDDLSAGDQTRLDARVFFHRGEITNRPKLWTLLQGVQCVYHLAARVLVAESILYPREYNEVNVGGTVALLEAMRDVGVPRLVFTSSGAIYGAQTTQPVSETMTPSPQSPYAVSKLAAEYYVHTIGALWGTTTVALRIFNAYGPGQPLLPAHSPVVPRFMHQALGGGSLVVFGNGEQTRDFVYVDDVVRALMAALTALDVDHRTINIGSGEETSILALAQQVLALTGSSSNIIHSPVEGGGVTRLRADVTLARQRLGYEPQVTLQEGLRRTLAEDSRFRQR